MKTKSQVTLIKKNKTVQSLSEAIEQNIKSIDNLNAIVESILAFGRAEGAQFDEAKETNIIKYLNDIIDEFEIVAIKEEKFITRRIKSTKLTLKIQPMLFRHIMQNLIQNAINFTPKGEKIHISAFECNNKFIIRVKDNGSGISENMDLFAPFKRSSNSKGTGLGLFLAKNAANSIGASIELKNRKNRKGAVATVIINI